MKKLMIIALLIITSNLFAGELDLKMITSSFISDDDNYQRGESNGIQLTYVPNKSFYLFTSFETINVYMTDKAFDYSLLGVGFGHKIKLTKHINAFGQLGYYFIKNSWGARKREFNEGLLYYLNSRYANYNAETKYTSFQEFEVRNDNTFGGVVGIEMVYPITKNFNSTMSLSYRHMKIKEKVIGYRDAWANDVNHNWQFGTVRNYSSINFGVGLNYQF